jgi:hypothetical protein
MYFFGCVHRCFFITYTNFSAITPSTDTHFPQKCVYMASRSCRVMSHFYVCCLPSKYPTIKSPSSGIIRMTKLVYADRRDETDSNLLVTFCRNFTENFLHFAASNTDVECSCFCKIEIFLINAHHVFSSYHSYLFMYSHGLAYTTLPQLDS